MVATPKAQFLTLSRAGREYPFAGTSTLQIIPGSLRVNSRQIPLLKILNVDMGKKLFRLQILNSYAVPCWLHFGFKKPEQANEFINELMKAIRQEENQYTAEEISLARSIASPDTCSDCGRKGGMTVITQWMYSLGYIVGTFAIPEVLCRRHSTLKALGKSVLSLICGVWGVGIISIPVVWGINTRALWRNSLIPRWLIAAVYTIIFLSIAWLAIHSGFLRSVVVDVKAWWQSMRLVMGFRA